MIPGAGRSIRVAAGLLAAGCIGLHGASDAVASENSPRAAMLEGQRLYAAGAYDKAAQSFREAAESALARGWDPTPAWMNLGHALHGGGRHREAHAAYRQAALTTDLQRQARAHYNAGTSLAFGGEALVQAGNAPGARESFEDALQEFDMALRLVPDDEAAQINRDWTEERLQEIKEQTQQQPEREPGEEDDEAREERDPDDGVDPENDREVEPAPEPGPDREGEEESLPVDGDIPETEPVPDPDKEDEVPREFPDVEPEDPSVPDIEEALSILDALREQEEAQRRDVRLRLGAPEAVERDW